MKIIENASKLFPLVYVTSEYGNVILCLITPSSGKTIPGKIVQQAILGSKKQSDGCFYINSAFCQVNSHTGVNT